jgi:hypothetical protein
MSGAIRAGGGLRESAPSAAQAAVQRAATAEAGHHSLHFADTQPVPPTADGDGEDDSNDDSEHSSFSIDGIDDEWKKSDARKRARFTTMLDELKQRRFAVLEAEREWWQVQWGSYARIASMHALRPPL